MKKLAHFLLALLAFSSARAMATDLKLPARTKNPSRQVAAAKTFQSFVQSLTIMGVYKGNPPKVYIDNQVFRVGDVLDRGLGVRLAAIDLVGHAVTFEDKTGAKITKPF